MLSLSLILETQYHITVAVFGCLLFLIIVADTVFRDIFLSLLPKTVTKALLQSPTLTAGFVFIQMRSPRSTTCLNLRSPTSATGCYSLLTLTPILATWIESRSLSFDGVFFLKLIVVAEFEDMP